MERQWLNAEHLRMVAWDRGSSHVMDVAEPVKENLRHHLLSAGELMRSNALEAALPSTKPADQQDLFETLA